MEVLSFPHAGCERRAERTAGEDRHINSQRKWRKQVVGQAVLSGGRIAQLFSDCRIMLQSTEMLRHGRRGKEKSSHGGRVSTVSSGIENLRA